MDEFPAVKWFSGSDQSMGGPFPVTCFRVDRSNLGGSWKDWIAWYKLLKLVEFFPP